jgi:hypothetical protein
MHRSSGTVTFFVSYHHNFEQKPFFIHLPENNIKTLCLDEFALQTVVPDGLVPYLDTLFGKRRSTLPAAFLIVLYSNQEGVQSFVCIFRNGRLILGSTQQLP